MTVHGHLPKIPLQNSMVKYQEPHEPCYVCSKGASLFFFIFTEFIVI